MWDPLWDVLASPVALLCAAVLVGVFALLLNDALRNWWSYPLFPAAKRGDLARMQALLDRGVDPNRLRFGETALAEAVRMRRLPAAVILHSPFCIPTGGLIPMYCQNCAAQVAPDATACVICGWERQAAEPLSPAVPAPPVGEPPRGASVAAGPNAAGASDAGRKSAGKRPGASASAPHA